MLRGELIPLHSLPTINAALNATSALLLITGWFLIRSRRINAHRAAMLGAFFCSGIFLSSYLYYHYHVGSVRYQGQGLQRKVYFSILISHTLLAVAVLPLILRSLYLAARSRFEEHKRWAKWALPLWLYVSVTGVVVYLMLYRL